MFHINATTLIMFIATLYNKSLAYKCIQLIEAFLDFQRLKKEKRKRKTNYKEYRANKFLTG
jgi:hypothetical protein